jgi:hypothetical protein
LPWAKNPLAVPVSPVSAALRERALFSDALDEESYQEVDVRMDEIMSVPLTRPTDKSSGGRDA